MRLAFIYLIIFLTQFFLTNCTESEKKDSNAEKTNKTESSAIKNIENNKNIETSSKKIEVTPTKSTIDKKEENLKLEKENDKNKSIDQDKEKKDKELNKEKIDQPYNSKIDLDSKKIDDKQDKKIDKANMQMQVGVAQLIKNAYNPREILPSQRDLLNSNDIVDKINKTASIANDDKQVSESIKKLTDIDEKFNNLVSDEYNHFIKIGIIKNKLFDLDAFKNAVLFKPFILFPISLFEEYYKSYPQCTIDNDGIELPCYLKYSEIINDNNLIDLIKKSDFNKATNILKKLIYALERELQELESSLNGDSESISDKQQKILELNWILKDLERMGSSKNQISLSKI